MTRPKLVPSELRAAYPDLWGREWAAAARRVGDVYAIDARQVAEAVQAVLDAREAEANLDARVIADAKRNTARRRAQKAARERAAVAAVLAEVAVPPEPQPITVRDRAGATITIRPPI